MHDIPEPRPLLELTLPSELGYEKLVWQMLAWLAPRLALAPPRVADLQTAVCEACINAVEHGNQGRAECRIAVRLVVTDRYVEAIVTDAGVRRFVAPATPPATIADKIGGQAPARGMGLMLMRALVDEVELGAAADGGNRCRLRIYTSPE